MRVRPRRGRTRSASEVARSRLRGLPHAPQSQPCFDSPVSRLPGLPHAPQSQPRFFTATSLSGSSYSPAVTLFFLVSFWYDTNGRYTRYIFTSAPNERVLRVTQLAKLSFNHPFALQQSIRLVYTRRALSRGRNREGTTRMHTHRNSTHTRQRRQNTTASPRLRRGAGRCCCRAAAAAAAAVAAAAAAVLLLCCCYFTTRDASRSTNRHNRRFLVLCFLERTQKRVTAQQQQQQQ